MDALSDLESETLRRELSLLDFLEAFHRRRFPPVRDISKFSDFLLRGHDLPVAPGVTLAPGTARWLTLKLVAHPTPPSYPTILLSTSRAGICPHAQNPCCARTSTTTRNAKWPRRFSMDGSPRHGARGLSVCERSMRYLH